MEVEPLQIDETDLNTKRMLDLMAVKQDDGPKPLYLHTIDRILRGMRITQQKKGGKFDYGKFKEMVDKENLTPAQLGPLYQRLNLLESFMPSKEKATPTWGNDWSPKACYSDIVLVETKLTFLGWKFDSRGPFLSLHHPRGSLWSFQYLSWHFPRGKDQSRPCCRTR